MDNILTIISAVIGFGSFFGLAIYLWYVIAKTHKQEMKKYEKK